MAVGTISQYIDALSSIKTGDFNQNVAWDLFQVIKDLPKVKWVKFVTGSTWDYYYKPCWVWCSNSNNSKLWCLQYIAAYSHPADKSFLRIQISESVRSSGITLPTGIANGWALQGIGATSSQPRPNSYFPPTYRDSDGPDGSFNSSASPYYADIFSPQAVEELPTVGQTSSTGSSSNSNAVVVGLLRDIHFYYNPKDDPLPKPTVPPQDPIVVEESGGSPAGALMGYPTNYLRLPRVY